MMPLSMIQKVINRKDKTIEAQRARIAELEQALAAVTFERDRLRDGLTWTTKKPTKAGRYCRWRMSLPP